MRPARLVRGRWLAAASLALAAALVAASFAAPCGAAGKRADVPDVAVKAAFLYNFAKFAHWPALPAGGAIVLCIAGDEGVSAALVETVRGQHINGHGLEVWRPQDAASWTGCHLLFIADAESRRWAGALDEIKMLPILTVSDAKGFAHAGGIVELYVDGGRMRFAINVDCVERSGLYLSSRLLGLAKIIRNDHAQ